MSGFIRHLMIATVIAVAAPIGAGAPVILTTPAAHAAPVPRAPAEPDCAEPGKVYESVPWAQQVMAPERVWPFTRGGDIRVAVLSSGVDASHPQLADRVEAGFDAVANRNGADTDCVGAGTQVAGLIAAQQAADVGFVGLAPSVRLVPVRVAAEQSFASTAPAPAVLARGIDWAVANGVHVIDIPFAIYSDDNAVRASISAAVLRGVTVVAAVGDQGGPNAGNPTPYPAAYPGVIGVGAINQLGIRWDSSQHGDYVDLVAPGAGVVTLQRVRGMAVDVSGTGPASGLVAATAALVRARRGDVSPAAMENRLAATATPMPVGPDFGRGMVNPYAAINDTLAAGSPAPLPALTRPGNDRGSAWARARDLAVIGTLVAAGCVIAVLTISAATPRGRRRRWRAAIAPPPPEQPEPGEPGPPVVLFEEENNRAATR